MDLLPPEGDHAVDFCSRLGLNQQTLAPMASLISITPLRMTYIYVTGAFYHSKDLACQLTPWCRVLLEKPKKKSLSWQEIPCFLWHSKVLCCVRKILPQDPILDQMNPIHTLQPCLLKIHFNIILPSASSYSKLSLSSLISK
jgi:hypothetical protein